MLGDAPYSFTPVTLGSLSTAHHPVFSFLKSLLSTVTLHLGDFQLPSLLQESSQHLVTAYKHRRIRRHHAYTRL